MQQGVKCFNLDEISDVCKKQEKKENRKRAPVLSRNAAFRR